MRYAAVMTGLALDPAYRRLTVAEFLGMNFGDSRAELVDGLVYMMTGGTEAHARVATNIAVTLGMQLRGSGCRPYNSDFAVRTGEASIRYPDLSVYCRDAKSIDPAAKLMGDPVVIIEVLSPSTAALDQRDKLMEYRALSGVRLLLFVDPDTEHVRVVRRTAPNGWTDDLLPRGADIPLPEIGATLAAADIFAID